MVPKGAPASILSVAQHQGKPCRPLKTPGAEAEVISDNHVMSISQASAPIEVARADPRTIDTDLVVLPVFEHEFPRASIWERATGGDVERAVASGEFKGKVYELFVTPAVDPAWQPRRIGFLGAGPRVGFCADRARKIAAALGIAARQRHIERVSFAIPDGFESSEIAQAVAEGLTLAEFDAGRYKTTGDEPVQLRTLNILLKEDGRPVAECAGAVQRGRLLAECSNLARQLANEPGNRLTPRLLAERAMELGCIPGLSVDVLD